LRGAAGLTAFTAGVVYSAKPDVLAATADLYLDNELAAG
jgi:hypothetical protein